MRKLKLSDITIEKIKSRKLKRIIPEFYRLEDIVENNPWHNQESVFYHTLSVLDNLEKIIRNSSKNIKKTLSEIVDINPRRNLLYLAALLHDVGKKETITDLGDRNKGCPGHEKKGAQKTEKILKRFNLSSEESKIVTDIVRNHGIMHDIVGLRCKDFKKGAGKEYGLTHAVVGLENKDFQREYKHFKKKFSKIYLELILLVFADTIGSYLKKTKPAEFRHRINFYKKELKNLPNRFEHRPIPPVN